MLSTEERIELLKKAREAKAKKKAIADALKPTPKKGRPLKKVEVKEEQVEPEVKEPEVTPEVKEEIPVKDTFKKTTKNEVEEVNLQKEDSSEDEVIIEEIKKKKKKKKIIRRIIEQSSSSDEEIQEVYIPKTKSKKVVKIEPEHIPKPVNVQKPEPNPFFCY